MKSLVYIKNEFLMKSAEAIKSLITQNSMPFHLEELRLINCKISAQATSLVLDSLAERSFVKKLSLVNASVNEPSCIKKLVYFMQGSRYLIDLDISWNNIKTA